MSEQLYVLADDGFSIRNTETGKRFFTLNSLKKELNEKQAEINKLKKENFGLYDGVDCLQEINSARKDEIYEKDRTIEEQQTFIKSLEEKVKKQEKQLSQLSEENERLLECSFGQLAFARMGDFSIQRDDRGQYRVFSEHVTPKDSPCIIIKSPSVKWNEFIVQYISKLIEQFGDRL